MSGIMSLFTGGTPEPSPAPVVAVPTVDPTPQEDPETRASARKKRESALAALMSGRVNTQVTGGGGDSSSPDLLRKTLG
jgi:hypothetical protein